MESRDRILIVDDDADIRALLGQYLEKNGYATAAVADGKAMRNALARSKVDLIVLDLMLPGEDGLVLCRELRAQGGIPIIMLTARGEQTDRIVGLEMGADDYLAKPFSPRELLARIKSVLRRYRSLPNDANAEDARRFDFAGWRLDATARHLISRDGAITPLSGSEYRLLRVFLAHPQRVLNRDRLMLLARGRESEPFERSIDQQVSRLRHRLGDDPSNPAIIKTVRGEGYVLAVAVKVGR